MHTFISIDLPRTPLQWYYNVLINPSWKRSLSTPIPSTTTSRQKIHFTIKTFNNMKKKNKIKSIKPFLARLLRTYTLDVVFSVLARSHRSIKNVWCDPEIISCIMYISLLCNSNSIRIIFTYWYFGLNNYTTTAVENSSQ